MASGEAAGREPDGGEPAGPAAVAGLVAFHGSFTAAEMVIPLMVVRGADR